MPFFYEPARLRGYIPLPIYDLYAVRAAFRPTFWRSSFLQGNLNLAENFFRFFKITDLNPIVPSNIGFS